MSARHPSNRIAQALSEVGQTSVSRAVAWGLLACFVLPVAGVPLAQVALDWRSAENKGFLERAAPPLAELVNGVGGRLQEWSISEGVAGLLDLNGGLLSTLEATEEALEEQSLVRRWLVPRFQQIQTVALGLGNEQAYVGRDGWLFYRADVEHVQGRGFLEPRVLERRAREGDRRRAAPVPDPRPALIDFDRQLERRGIRLIVVPTPVKPSIHPELFSPRSRPEDAPVRNPSFERLIDDLRAEGVEVFDPAPLLAGPDARGEASYLMTDTHWSPAAVEAVAAGLARMISPEPAGDHGYSRRAVVVDGRGDLTAMLRYPSGFTPFRPQQVRLQQVLEPDGRSWTAPETAGVLLLGDSFANVFSDRQLGWGSGAGLAEQLSFELDQPVARLALNAGGAEATRLRLRRGLAAGRDRLDGVEVVVYQFANRELGQGSWPVLAID